MGKFFPFLPRPISVPIQLFAQKSFCTGCVNLRSGSAENFFNLSRKSKNMLISGFYKGKSMGSKNG